MNNLIDDPMGGDEIETMRQALLGYMEATADPAIGAAREFRGSGKIMDRGILELRPKAKKKGGA